MLDHLTYLGSAGYYMHRYHLQNGKSVVTLYCRQYDTSSGSTIPSSSSPVIDDLSSVTLPFRWQIVHRRHHLHVISTRISLLYTTISPPLSPLLLLLSYPRPSHRLDCTWRWSRKTIITLSVRLPQTHSCTDHPFVNCNFIKSQFIFNEKILSPKLFWTLKHSCIDHNFIDLT